MWLGRESVAPAPAGAQPGRAHAPHAWIPEMLRLAMCAAAVVFLAALQAGAEGTWIPLAVLVWGLAIAADVVERGRAKLARRAVALARRSAAAFLVFHYVCLAWIFFRAMSFSDALAVLRRLAAWELDRANLVPMVTTALAVGFSCHFFADGSFRWLRDRFVSLPAPARGIVLAAAALVLRELGHARVVPFIYFQF